MIKKIRISNYQIHKNLSLEFSPGLNVIVGASDEGKSSIVRALRTILFNEPSGVEYLPSGKKKFTGEVLFSDGVKVIRERSKSANTYKLNVGGEEKTYKAFGTNSPFDVQKAVNMDEVNLHPQFSLPFLIALTPSERNRYINEFTRRDFIDAIIKHFVREEGNCNKKIAEASEEIDNVTNEITSLDWVGEAEKDLSRLERINEEKEEYLQAERNIREAIREVRRIESRLGEVQYLTQWEEEFKILWQKEEELRSYRETEFDLEEAISSLKRIDTRLKRSLKYEEINRDFQALKQVGSELDNYKSKEKEIEEELHWFDKFTNSLAEKEKEIEELEKEKSKLLAINQICPLCGYEFDIPL